jgi:hypothetical protein
MNMSSFTEFKITTHIVTRTHNTEWFSAEINGRELRGKGGSRSLFDSRKKAKAAAMDRIHEFKQGGELRVMIDTTCSRCKGCGHISAMDGNGPDAQEVDINCPQCEGTGAV